MNELNRCLVWLTCILIILFANAAIGGDTRLVCPAQATSGQTVTADMTFSNDECAAVTLRVISSIVGNSSGTLAGLSIFGPEVSLPMALVPAGTDVTCGCVDSLCECGEEGVSCTTDAECPFCNPTIPGTLNMSVDLIALPQSLVGTVATYILVTEFDSGTEVDTETSECFVEVL